VREGLLRSVSDPDTHALGRPGELPMAPAGCILDDGSLAAQLARYRQLGTTADRVEGSELGLTVTFDEEVDVDLVHATIAIERGCCSFLTVDYDASSRRLSIGIDDPARAGALRALRSALTDAASPPG
jgi:hypothetical protein